MAIIDCQTEGDDPILFTELIYTKKLNSTEYNLIHGFTGSWAGRFGIIPCACSNQVFSQIVGEYFGNFSGSAEPVDSRELVLDDGRKVQTFSMILIHSTVSNNP